MGCSFQVDLPAYFLSRICFRPKKGFQFLMLGFGRAPRLWYHLKKAIWVFWIKMKMIFNRPSLGQNVPPGLLYPQHYLVASYKSTILKKTFLCFFIFFSKCLFLDSASATTLNVLSLFKNFHSTRPKFLLCSTLCSAPRKHNLPALLAVPAVPTQCPKSRMNERTDRAVIPAVTQTHSMA